MPRNANLFLSGLLNNVRGIQYLFCFGLILFAFGIPWAVFIVSNSVMFLAVLMLFKFDASKGKIKFNTAFFTDLKRIIQIPLIKYMLLFFCSVAITFFWSEDLKTWSWFTRMLLPFLVLPITFTLHGQLKFIEWKIIFCIFIVTVFGSTFFILFNYLGNYAEYNLQLLKGKPIVSHISHIRFSMMIAIAVVSGLYFLIQKQTSFKSEKWILGFIIIYLFFFNHLISVKTGIIGMDMGLLSFFIIYFLNQKNYKAVYFSIGGMVLLVSLAFFIFPSIQNKFYYTIWQFGEWQRGKWLYYSDIERFVSIQLGIEMICHHPILGSGMGDLYQMTAETYEECLNHRQPMLPHNQFIFSWAFTGIASLFCLLAMIWHSILQKSWYRHPLILSIQIILLSSFMVEYTLGTQIGCSLYVFFTLICWAFIRDKTENAY